MLKDIDYESIAAQIHHYYFAKWSTSKLPAKYDDLPEFMKEDNRAAARRISDVLSMAGLCLVRNSGQVWSDDEQQQIRSVIDENLRLLAEAEHDGWMVTRLRQGWKPGVETDYARREHHLIAPYSEFSARVEAMMKHQWKRADESKMSADVREEARVLKPTAENIRVQVQKAIEKDSDSVRNYVEIIGGTDYRIVREKHTDAKC
ncbi:MAG: RyR domain-containing protein [Planctomycetaceae bacterium]